MSQKAGLANDILTDSETGTQYDILLAKRHPEGVHSWQEQNEKGAEVARQGDPAAATPSNAAPAAATEVQKEAHGEAAQGEAAQGEQIQGEDAPQERNEAKEDSAEQAASQASPANSEGGKETSKPRRTSQPRGGYRKADNFPDRGSA